MRNGDRRKAALPRPADELLQAEAAASNLTSRNDFAVPKYWEAVGYLLLGIVSYERNHLGKAEGYFINVQSRRYDSLGLTYAGAAAGLVRIELARGDIEGAERHINAARVFADETKSSMLELASEAAARYLDIAVGRSLDASAAPPPVADFMHVAVSAPSHSWAWAALHCPAEGMSQAALDYIGADDSIHEVLLSGGDPLVAADHCALLLVGAVTGGFAVAANASMVERLQGPYTALPTLIFSWARQPKAEFRELTAAAIIVLLVLVLLINAIAIILRNRYARKW